MKYDYESNKEYQKEYQKNSPNAKAARKRYYEKTRGKVDTKHMDSKDQILFIRKQMLTNAKTRARQKELDFDLTLDDIQIPMYCPVLGIELYIGKEHGVKDHSPTLDRIDNDEGYVKWNVKVISGRANRLKSDARIKDLERIILYMKDPYYNKQIE